MKKHKTLTAILIILILTSLLFGFFFWRFFYSLSFLPEGDLIDSKKCSTCGTLVNAYLVNTGATNDYCIRCEAIYTDGKAKNIYWASHEQKADLEWKTCDTIMINGKELNIYKDRYDFRRTMD